MDSAAIHHQLAEAVFADRIMCIPQGDQLDTAHLIADVVEELHYIFGVPSDDEVIEFGAVLASKVSGMAADTDATFAGLPVTIEDGQTVDGMDGYRITVGDSNALFSFDEDEMELIMR